MDGVEFLAKLRRVLSSHRVVDEQFRKRYLRKHVVLLTKGEQDAHFESFKAGWLAMLEIALGQGGQAPLLQDPRRIRDVQDIGDLWDE